MKKVEHISTIAEYNKIAEHPTLNPLVSVIDFSKTRSRVFNSEKPQTPAITFGFYAVFFKQSENCIIRYGRRQYDYKEGTLVFIAPGQIVSIEEDGKNYEPNGYALLFHPDLLRGTALGHNMKDYTFFSYDVAEALHLSGCWFFAE